MAYQETRYRAASISSVQLRVAETRILYTRGKFFAFK